MPSKILIALQGQNVLQSSLSLDYLLLNSAYPFLQVHKFNTFTISPPSVLKTVEHDLGYYPFTMVFSQLVKEDGSVTDEYYQHNWDILLVNEIFGRTDILKNTIEIRVGGPVDAARDVQGFYYIFKNKMRNS